MSKPDIPNRFVSGLFFSHDFTGVALLYKQSGPAFLRDTWTGVGGHMQVGEGIRTAMAREFREEAGLLVPAERWFGFHSMRFHNTNVCHFLVAKADQPDEFSKLVRVPGCVEPVGNFQVNHVLHRTGQMIFQGPYPGRSEFNPELAFLIPLALRKLTLPMERQDLGY